MKRMSSQDAAFLYAETPSWHMHVAALAVVDPAASEGRFSFDALRRLTAERLPSMPQLRWELVDVPFGIDRPGWVESTDLDLDYHIRRVTLPDPGTDEQLDALVASLVETKLDRARPLWEMYVIDGLVGGKSAVLTKVHHSLIDGVSGAGIAEILMDITPEPRPAPEEISAPIAGGRPNDVYLLWRGAIRSAVRTPLRMTRFGVQSLRQAASAVTEVGSRTSSLTLPYTAPRTHLNGEFTPRRALGRASLPLDRVQAVKQRLGALVEPGQPRVTVNDVVLTLCAGAFRSYLDDRGELPAQPLVIQIPVSLRTDKDKADVGSKVGTMFARLATHIDDPLDRFHVIRESTTAGKALTKAMGEHREIGVTATMTPGFLGLAARLFTAMHLERAPSAVNFVVSNVPGPRIPLYMCGAPVEAFYPMGPLLLGMGLNVTLFSFDNQIDIGVFSCPDLVPEPGTIAARFAPALEELERAVAASA